MSAVAAVSRSWTVGQFVVTLSIPKAELNAVATAAIEWAPHMPSRLTGPELDQYLAGRNAAIAELSQALGLRSLVVDLP